MTLGIANSSSGARRSRWRALALIVGWLALAISSFAHVGCAAAHSGPAGLGGKVPLSDAVEAAPSQPDDRDDECETLPDLAAPPEPAGFSAALSHGPLELASVPGPESFPPRADGLRLRSPPLFFLADGRRLYLRTARLLI